MRRSSFSLPGNSDPSLQLPLHTALKTSSLPKKSLQGVLFDLIVVASFVAASWLGGRGIGQALSVPKQPTSAAIGSDYNATESHPSALIIKNRRQHEGLQQLKADVTEERTRLMDEVDDGDGAEDLARSLREANQVLLQIELSQRVLELERLSLPLSAGVTAMGAGMKAHAGLTGQLARATRFVDDHAAQLDEFRDRVAAFRALDARVVDLGVTLHEGYRKKMDGHERLNGEFEDLRSKMEELQTTMRSVLGSEL